MIVTPMENVISPRCCAVLTLGAIWAVATTAACGSAPIEEPGAEPHGEVAEGAEPAEILVLGERVFPESITSTGDGTIIVGSMGAGNVYRALPGEATATEWIPPQTGGLGTVLGVFADDASGTLWVCSNNMDGTAPEPTALKAFDLTTAELTGTYPLEGDRPVCNGIAVAANGAVYIADTSGQVVMLPAEGDSLTLVSDHETLNGADGLAFGADPDVLYVNNVRSGQLLRLDLGEDGQATSVTDLVTSRDIVRPDGMRSIGPDRLLLAELEGRMSLVTIDGDTATVETLLDLGINTPAVTAARGRAWLVEGKLDLRQDPESDPGEFRLVGVPLPE